MGDNTGYIKKCFTCKKKFSTYTAYAGWAYQRHAGTARHFFCSYNCMRKYDMKREGKLIMIDDTCAHFVGDDEYYVCELRKRLVTCEGCKDYLSQKQAGDQEWEARQNEGKSTD